MSTQSKTMDVLAQADMVKEFSSSKKIPVIEIFGPTIQGEGPLVGSKTLFIRFGGCDFRCTKCDSLHAVIPSAVKANARRMTQQEIFEEVTALAAASATDWITLSGGNPSLWDLTELVTSLREARYLVAVETQGTLCPDWLNLCHMIVTSPKTPGMGENFDRQVFAKFLQHVKVPIALKPVIFSAMDVEWALDMGDLYDKHQAGGLKFLSLGNPFPPTLKEDGTLEESTLNVLELLKHYQQTVEDIILIDPRLRNWRVLPQLHVVLWGNESER